MKSNVHLRVDDSKNKRINVLKSAKLVAEGLRDYNSFKKLRERRKKLMVRLENVMFQIGTAFDELKIKDVPSMHVVDHEEQEVEIKKPVVQKEVKPVEAPIRMDKKEMQLARELEEIERKLASL